MRTITKQSHALNELTDRTQPGEPPAADIASTWNFDTCGHIEFVGQYAEDVWHNREVSKGLTDPHQDLLTQDSAREERVWDDAVLLAKEGGVVDLGDMLDQGQAALVFSPAWEQNANGKWAPNKDAKAAARLMDSLHRTEQAPGWRHDSQIDLRLQIEEGDPLDAINHGPRDPDWLSMAVNSALFAEYGKQGPPTSMDGVQIEDLHPDYWAHLVAMACAQYDRLENERKLLADRDRDVKVIVKADPQDAGAQLVLDEDAYWRITSSLARAEHIADARKAQLIPNGISGAGTPDPYEPPSPQTALRQLRADHEDTGAYRVALHQLVKARPDVIRHLAKLTTVVDALVEAGTMRSLGLSGVCPDDEILADERGHVLRRAIVWAAS